MQVRSPNKWVLGLAVIALTISLAACGGNSNKGTNNAGTGNNAQNPGNEGNAGNGATVDTAAAEEVYKKSCIGCHAADLAGGVGPNLQKVGSEMTADQIEDTIVNGKGGMPAFKGQLTDEEINSLAGWLAAKK